MSEFYLVLYHSPKGKGKRKSIVPAEDIEDATKKFNNPDDPYGMRYEVDEVKKVAEIPEGWVVSVIAPNGFPLGFKAKEAIPLDKPHHEFTNQYKVRDIISANPPTKEHVIDKLTW